MANNDEYTDEYNDEYLCRDFFVGFNFWSRLSFQISEFRVHCIGAAPPGNSIAQWCKSLSFSPLSFTISGGSTPIFFQSNPVNSKYTWKDNLAAIFEAKLKAAIDNRGVKK